MSENERHRNLKTDLLQWLQEATRPELSQRMHEIVFQCNDHIHFWQVPTWVAFIDVERRMQHPEDGHYRPDVAVLDYKGNPIAVLEVKHKNRRNKAWSAARILGIPYFRFDCPPPAATAHELWVRQDERPWYWQDDAKSFHAEWEGEPGDDGEVVYKRPIRVVGNQPGSVIMGPMAWANATNLTCEGATWLQNRERGWGLAEHYRDARAETARDIGRTLMHEIETRRQNPHYWTAGIGELQLAGTVGIYPLNPDLETGKYLPCDITSLLDKWGNETVAMHRALDVLNQRQRPKPCQMFR